MLFKWSGEGDGEGGGATAAVLLQGGRLRRDRCLAARRMELHCKQTYGSFLELYYGYVKGPD